MLVGAKSSGVLTTRLQFGQSRSLYWDYSTLVWSMSSSFSPRHPACALLVAQAADIMRRELISGQPPHPEAALLAARRAQTSATGTLCLDQVERTSYRAVLLLKEMHIVSHTINV